MGAVQSASPTTFDKVSRLALAKRWAEQYGLSHETLTVAGLQDTVVTIYKER